METNLLAAAIFLLILFLVCSLQQSRERVYLRNVFKPAIPPMPEKIKFYYV